MTTDKMRNNTFLHSLYILLFLFFLGCYYDTAVPATSYEIPSLGHDLSYIPFDAQTDNPNYTVCDSTGIGSGRSRLQYIGGASKLRKDIKNKYAYKQAFESYSGLIVIRFIVNCKNETGRYRAQSFNEDFSVSNAPSDLLTHSIEVIKGLDSWSKPNVSDREKEYSKFIKLKIRNGKIQHVLL